MLTMVAFLLLQQGYEQAVDKVITASDAATTGPAKVAVGDDLIKLVSKYPKKRQDLIDQASRWYGEAWLDLDDVWKAKLRERLAQLYAPTRRGPKKGLPGGWSGPGTPDNKVEIVSERVRTGLYAAKLIPTSKPANARLFLTEGVPVKPGQTVTFSAWVLSDGTTGGHDGSVDHLRFYVGGRHVKSANIPKDFPIWKKLEVELEIPEDIETVRMEAVVFSKKGVVFVDDVSVLIDGKERLPSGGFE